MSNLLEKASIITTPTAYSDGVLHSVKPSLPTSLEPTFFNLGSWNWDGSILSASPATGGTKFENDIFLEKKTYIITFKVLSYVSGSLGYRFGGGAVKGSYFDSELIEGNTITLEAQSDATVANFQFLTSNFNGSLSDITFTQLPAGDFTFTRNNPGTRVNASGNIESVGVDLPRIDYRGGSGSLLLEPQATNTATDSNDFTTGDIFEGSSNPSVTDAILTSQQATSPDGTNNAWKLVDNNDSSSGATGFKYGGTNLVSNNYNTLSLFVKKQGNNDFIYIKIQNFDSTTSGVTYFNVSNGTLGNVASNHTASIDDYGNGWYRIVITFQAITDLLGQIQIYLATSNGNVSITRDGTNGVYIYGLQAESHATRQYATSYIPTSGSPQTRGADSSTDAGSSDLISSTEGVFYAELKSISEFVDSPISISINNNSDTNRLLIYKITGDNKLKFQIKNATETIDFTSATTNIGFDKVAIKWVSTDTYAFWINGVEVASEDLNGTQVGMNNIDFSADDTNSPFQGNIKCVAVFKEALTDAELTCLTTI